LIEAPHRASEYLDLFIRGLFPSGLLVRLHDGRDSVSDIALPIWAFSITHEASAASVYHRIERVLQQFAGPQIKAEKMNPWTVCQEMSFKDSVIAPIDQDDWAMNLGIWNRHHRSWSLAEYRIGGRSVDG
jgi:hypothetical protein